MHMRSKAFETSVVYSECFTFRHFRTELRDAFIPQFNESNRSCLQIRTTKIMFCS